MKATLDQVEGQVLNGLPDEAARWTEAMRQHAYFELRGADLIRPREAENAADFAARPKLTSKLTYRAIRELSKGLYAPGPTRTLDASQAVADQYAAILEQNHAQSLLQTADRYAWLHGVFLIGVMPTGNPERPVRLDPWRADECAVFLEDDDPRTPWAVCVRSLFPARKQVRYQLWDATEVRTYWTEVGDIDPIGRNGRTVRRDPERSGPHGLGVLPFVAVHNEPPVCGFWVEGVGRALADAEAVLDAQLSDLAQGIRAHCIPMGFSENVSNMARFVHRPGDFIDLSRRDPEREARVFYSQPELRVEEVWLAMSEYANRTMLALDLPLTANPEDAYPESGIAIVARRMPLISLWQARRTQFVPVEEALKRTILTVAGRYAKSAEWEAAAGAPLTVEFPEPALPLPTPERDEADRSALALGTTSRIRMVMQRHGLTRPAAIAYLEQVARDLEEERRIYGAPDAAARASGERNRRASDSNGTEPEPDDDDDDDDEVRADDD